MIVASHIFRWAGVRLSWCGAAAALLAACSSLGCAVRRHNPPEVPWTFDPVVQATNRGVASMERYDYAGAVEAFDEALQRGGKSTEISVNLAIATFNRASRGDLERAERLLDDVLLDESENVRALYFRAIIHQLGGRDDLAIPCFDRVLKLRPDDAYVWYFLARSKSHLGQPCRVELERAVQLNPALASAYYDLMRIATQAGQEDLAKAYRERFEQLTQSPLHEMVVVPHYRKMGSLAIVQPLSGAPRRSAAGGELAAETARTLFEVPDTVSFRDHHVGDAADLSDPFLARWGVEMALADVNGDGRLDIVAAGVVRNGDRGLLLLLARPDGRFDDATESWGLTSIRGAISCAFGDYDNDNRVDLFVSCAGPNHLLRNRGDGTFEDVTERTRTGGPNVVTASATFLDADHDGDLDIYVCNTMAIDGGSPASNQLLNNNGDGTFTDIAGEAGVACAGERSVMVAPADLDGDRDTDLVVFNSGAAARIFLNDRFGRYHEAHMTAESVRGDCGGVVQDFNGDGRPDLLVFPGPNVQGRLYFSNESGKLQPSAEFDDCIRTVSTWSPIGTPRVADMDLDGDLDIVLFDRSGRVLFNDGEGRFVAKALRWPPVTDDTLGAELTDMNADGVPDLVRIRAANKRIEVVPTRLTPPGHWLTISPTGDRGPDQRTRSPVSGFGTRLELHSGLRSQAITYTGCDGALSQSLRPQVFGLNGASQADYLALMWPDGVTQCERELAAGTHHRVSETDRRISSCPVLFAWNGYRFEFVSDFAGVGGLGYFLAPGQYALPQVREHIKINPEQLIARDGFYELRVCEPMEEAAYIDRLELLAIDHPAEQDVYPDERLAVTGPPATHRLLCPTVPIFPVQALGPDGEDCTAQVMQADRVYAYAPEIDRRFVGFCRPHALVLDFADRLAELDSTRSVYLFMHGWIEYPYSQSTFAASQAGVAWQPLRIEGLSEDGQWEVVVPDAGAPGGLGRTIAVDLTGKLTTNTRKLRVSTNLEIYCDQVFVANDRGTDRLTVRSVPLVKADLRRLGFPLEYSPDGRLPTIYDYDRIAPVSPFKVLKGAYTRYGPVESLLADFDDRYAILAPGDEIAAAFDARVLPLPAAGEVRSFILISHAYCKDMDLYTAEPDTIAPLPFRSMNAYPYPAGEHYPDEPQLQQYRQQFNTRLVP